MIRNRLGSPARSLMVAAVVVCWITCVSAAAALPVQNNLGTSPQSLTAVASGPNSINLIWGPPTSTGGKTIARYRVEWATTGATFTLLATPAVTRYEHIGLAAGTTHNYRVRAEYTDASVGTWAIADATTTGSTGTPSEPLNLTATIVGSIATLMWDAPASTNVSTITHYEIHVSADGGGNWTFVAQTVAPTTTYVGPVTVGVVSTTFRVRAVNANGAGIPAFKTVATGSTGAPSAPLNLTATAAGPSAIDVDWDVPASDGGSSITSYEVSVSADGGVSWGPPQTTVLTSYQHTSLTAGVTRHYRVRARNVNGFGPWTSAESATTTTGTAPGPPRALTATAVSSSAIDLSWSAPLSSGSSAIVGYRIEASSTRTGVWSELVANTGNTSTTYEDTGLSPNTTRYYRVSAINSFGTGIPSTIEGATTELDVPDVPRQLTAQTQGTSAIELDWTAPLPRGTAPVTGYRIQRSSRGTGGWQSLVTNTGSTTTRYTDDGLSPGTTRYYRVACDQRARA